MDTALAVPEIGKRTATGRSRDGLPEAIELRLLGAHLRAANHLQASHQVTALSQSLFDLGSNRCIKNNDLDRLHLVQDVVDRVPGLGTKGNDLKQLMQDKLIEHKHYSDRHGGHLPEIRAWQLGSSV